MGTDAGGDGAGRRRRARRGQRRWLHAGLIDRIRSLFGGGATSEASRTAPTDGEPEAKPEGQKDESEEGDAEDEDEDEDGGGMPTRAVAEMADPRRHEDEENTVANRVKNPGDQRAT